MSVRALIAAASLSFLLACGGGGGGNPSPSPNPSPNPNPGSSNPCSTASSTGVLAPQDAAYASAKRDRVDTHSRYGIYDALALHAARRPRTAAAEPARDNVDIGEIAVVQDEGDIVTPPNSFDLYGAGVRFTRNGSGGYDARRIDGTFRSSLGRQLTLGDDDSSSTPSVFGFPFYGRTHTAAFVNSDGNVTFEEGDPASTERNVARLLTGPPRVAAFLADLDPSAGGRIFVNAASDQYTVTWCSVRGFDTTRVISTQLTLLPDGAIELKYASASGALSDAVVGVSPGRTGDFTPVNLADAGPNGGAAAVGERFAAQPLLDTVALLQKFYLTHPDNYEQVVIWTDTPLVQDAFAYEVTVANEIRGIGQPLFDASRDFGSSGRLRSTAVMDWIDKYPDDPAQRVLGENSTLSVLAHESGHRWLALLEFRDHTGTRSDALLGRQLAHWSFFFDSDASVMEGNDIEDLGGGSFRTVATVSRYSLLDQYAMGLVGSGQVPSMFYVQSPTNMSSSRTRESAPQTGITFSGTRRDVLIDDIIAVEGTRSPSVNESSKVHRQAFIFLSSAGRTPAAAAITKLDRIRTQWEPFFRQATDGRMVVTTTLR
jgi:hypothetical protein